jgi:hypothetical protein
MKIYTGEQGKKNNEPTQNWCCQSFHTERYTKAEHLWTEEFDVQ